MCRSTAWTFGARAGAIIALLLSASGRASATTIDFETVPGGTPSAGLAINSQYTATDGVTFSLQGGGSPVLIGVDDTTGPIGFLLGPHGASPNTPISGQGLGNFFLSDDGLLAAPHNLRMGFSSPMSTVSGDIIDIDHSDAWTISAIALSGGSTVVDQVILNTSSPGTGSGIATPFTVSSNTDNIDQVLLVMSGHGPNPGFGWDNFSFTSSVVTATPPPPSVPLPAAAWTAGSTLAALGMLSLRSRKSLPANR